MRKQFGTVMLLVAAVAILCASGSVTAQESWPLVWVDVTEIEGLNANGHIPPGGLADLVIPVRFTNIDEESRCVSNGYSFLSDDVTYSSLSGEWNPNYCWDGTGQACWTGGDIGIFDMGVFINVFDDVIGFAGVSGLSDGLPAYFDDIAYYITVEDIQGNPGDILTMDSTWWTPANYWLWCNVHENVQWAGPYQLMVGYEPLRDTWCTPQPTILGESDPLLEVHIRVPDPEKVDLESIRVLNIPPYDGYPVVEENVITTACLLSRFIGVSGFRPIPPEGIQSTYVVSFEQFDGQAFVLTGDYVLNVVPADVTLDGVADINDVQFIAEFFWGRGTNCKYEEFMDVNNDGTLDIRDAMKVVELTRF